MIYTQILKPAWIYGIQFPKQCHIKIIQTFQNKTLRNIVNAPWLARNSDLGIDNIATVIKRLAAKHEARLHQHVNVEAIQLLDLEKKIEEDQTL